MNKDMKFLISIFPYCHIFIICIIDVYIDVNVNVAVYVNGKIRLRLPEK